jgi:hypothetical protein|tara:strand:+ start:112 stop:279 length:168 start_codon:yes stop_codon:yes gene_type:complete
MKLRVPPTQKNSQYNFTVKTPLREQVSYIWESLSETARIAVKALLAKLTNKTTKT